MLLGKKAGLQELALAKRLPGDLLRMMIPTQQHPADS
jgi:hypothetical protein